MKQHQHTHSVFNDGIFLVFMQNLHPHLTTSKDKLYETNRERKTFNNQKHIYKNNNLPNIFV